MYQLAGGDWLWRSTTNCAPCLLLLVVVQITLGWGRHNAGMVTGLSSLGQMGDNMCTGTKGLGKDGVELGLQTRLEESLDHWCTSLGSS